jgi:hypothetical protein
MVAFHARHAHGADNIEAFLRIGIVTHDITEASVVRACFLPGVLEDDLECLQVRMDVGDNGVLHLVTFTASTDNGKSVELIRSIGPASTLLRDKSGQSGIANGLLESLQLVLSSFGNQFYPAIRQIANEACHFEAWSD